MTKIMLVEDDKSLREIYGVRLLAEGYDIVSAGDGEEALAMAIKERPRLIVSDVMMPKVSGYDMLDILRSTTETKNIRVIMMTALSSEEQRMRAESLGADRYLVKSQVGIEDVVRVVHEVLEDTPETIVPPTPPPVVPVSQPARSPVLAATPSQPSVSPPSVAVPPTPLNNLPPARPLSAIPKPASIKTRIIQPLHDPSIAPVNINDLLDKELAKEAGLTDTEIPVVESVDQEKAAIDEQLRSFIPPEPTPVEVPVGTQPTPPLAASPSLLPTPGVTSTAPLTQPTPPPTIPAATAPVAAPTTTPVVQPTPPPVTPQAPATPPQPLQPAPPVSAPVPPAPVAPAAPSTPPPVAATAPVSPPLPQVPSVP